jgi:hypothetical protein
MKLDAPIAEVERLLQDAEHRGGMWTVLEVNADLALYADLTAMGFRRPGVRTLAERWGRSRSDAHRLIVKFGTSPLVRTPTIAEELGQGLPATLEPVEPRHLVTIVREKCGMLRADVDRACRARQISREDCVQEVYERCLRKQRTERSYWQPHRASLGAWVYQVARSHLRNIAAKKAEPMVVADDEGLGRAAERRPMDWGRR